jgi:hypothetical protein
LDLLDLKDPPLEMHRTYCAFGLLGLNINRQRYGQLHRQLTMVLAKNHDRAASDRRRAASVP